MTWTDEDEKTLMELQFRRQEISSAQDTVWKKYGIQPRADLLNASDIAGLRADLAQFDPNESKHRWAAVNKLIEMGYRWTDGAWMAWGVPAEEASPIEPAWTSWSGGGGCPVIDGGTWIEVRYRNGDRYRGPAGKFFATEWAHYGRASDIVAYRICPVP